MNLPNFSSIKPEQIELKLDGILTANRQAIAKLLEQDHFTWDNLLQPLEDTDDKLDAYWSLVSHLHAVMDNDKLREAYNACLPKLAEYSTEVGHNKKLFAAIESIAKGPDFSKFDSAQQKVVEHALRDFKLAGVALNDEMKKEYAQLVTRLTKLTSKFEQNVLDATHAWHKHITDEAALSGLPEHARQMAKQMAQQRKLDGYLFTLDIPSYLAVIKFADSRPLREECYRAYVTRASEAGPTSDKWDNSEIMKEILALRLNLSKLLEFEHYAEESLATKMAESPQEVLDFLNQLADASLPKAKVEYSELEAFAKAELDIEKLEAWDVTYVSEKLRQKQYDISQEDLRPYFPQPQVLDGLFAVVKRLFGLDIKPVIDVDVWHKDVKCFAIYDESDALRSYFYIDLYARENKRGGAWMDDCQGRRKLANGEMQIPIAFVTCNFSGPVGSDPALFTHDDVVTLFHEFGHALQHMLTTIDYADVAGINGIPWDAVEVASQFLENYAWQKESLAFIAKHYKTGESLPDALFDKMQRAKNFLVAMQMMRQLEFALFDFTLHIEFDTEQEQQIQKTLNRVRDQVSVVPAPEFNRFQHSFSHIFAGGYAAGYYSYKWAEVMAADAFDLFLEANIFDKKVAKKYLEHILEPGGSKEFSEMFKAFRGRDPQVEALLKQSGIIE